MKWSIIVINFIKIYNFANHAILINVVLPKRAGKKKKSKNYQVSNTLYNNQLIKKKENKNQENKQEKLSKYLASFARNTQRKLSQKILSTIYQPILPLSQTQSHQPIIPSNPRGEQKIMKIPINKSQNSSSSLEENLNQHQLVTSSSSSSESYANTNAARIRDNMNISSQNHLSSYSEDNNQASNQLEEALAQSPKSSKSKSKGNSSQNEQREEGLPMIRSSRKIKKDYRNLSLASKYEQDEQAEIQSSASKKKKGVNSAQKSKKKKDNEIGVAFSSQGSSSGAQQQQHSRNQHQSTSQNQSNPHIKQFKNTILESFQKCKSKLPPKMFSYIQKQTQINLGTVTKVNVRLPKNEEYPDCINNIQKVLADQETIIKDLVGAQSNQSLFDFLTKQRMSKKEQLAHLQFLAKQKQEQINKINIEQLKQNLQYKINPQFIKSELKKELKHLKNQIDQKNREKDFTQSYTQQNYSESQFLTKEDESNSSFEIEVEKAQGQENISTKISTTKNKTNYPQQKAEINNQNSIQQDGKEDIQELQKIPSKKDQPDMAEGGQQSAQEGNLSTRKSSGSTKSSEEPTKISKKISQSNSSHNTASSTPTASQLIANNPYAQFSHQHQPIQNIPHHPIYNGNMAYSRHPLKQQMIHPHPHNQHPHQPHPEGYFMYHPTAGYPYQQQHHHPHFNQRYWEQHSNANGAKPYAKLYNQIAEINPNSHVSYNNNLPNNDSASTEQTTSSLYLSGENQENIFHNNHNIPYYNHLPNNQGFNQNISHNTPYPHQFAYDSHSLLKRDQQVLSNSMRINRNGTHPTNFYQHNYPQNPTSSTPLPIPDYQNNLGTNFSTDFNDQGNLSFEPQNNQQHGSQPGYNSNEKDQLASNISTQKREEFFNDLDEAFEDSLSNFNMKSFHGSKMRKGLFDNDLDMEIHDQYSQNLMDFN